MNRVVISLIVLVVTGFSSNYGAAAAAASQPHERAGITIARQRLPKLWVDYLVQHRQVDDVLQKRMDALFESEPIKGLLKKYETIWSELIDLRNKDGCPGFTQVQKERLTAVYGELRGCTFDLGQYGLSLVDPYRPNIFTHQDFQGLYFKISRSPVPDRALRHAVKMDLRYAPTFERLASRVLLADVYNAIARKHQFKVLGVVDKRVYFANSVDNPWFSMIVVSSAVGARDGNVDEEQFDRELQLLRAEVEGASDDWYHLDGGDIGYARNTKWGTIYDSENAGLLKDRLTNIFTKHVLSNMPAPVIRKEPDAPMPNNLPNPGAKKIPDAKKTSDDTKVSYMSLLKKGLAVAGVLAAAYVCYKKSCLGGWLQKLMGARS